MRRARSLCASAVSAISALPAASRLASSTRWASPRLDVLPSGLVSALAAPACAVRSFSSWSRGSLSLGGLALSRCAAVGAVPPSAQLPLAGLVPSVARRGISTKRRRSKAMNKHKYEKLKKKLRNLTGAGEGAECRGDAREEGAAAE